MKSRRDKLKSIQDIFFLYLKPLKYNYYGKLKKFANNKLDHMKFIYITVSVLLLIVFSISLNFLGIKNHIYKTYPNLELRKKMFSKQSVMHHFKNDYNDNFLPETQFLELNFKKISLIFHKSLKSKNSYNNKPNDGIKTFFIEPVENNLLIIDAFGNFYFEDIKFIKNKKSTENSIKLKKITSNFSEKNVLGTMVHENFLYIYYSVERNGCWFMGIDIAKINLNNLNFKNFFKSDECAKNYIEIGRMQTYEHNGSVGILVASAMHPAGEDNHSQSDDSIFGKILFIDLDKRKHIIFSKGHRVPQGLYAESNLIISTEHGPKGGDEINRIFFKKNYGWPLSSYGEPYAGSFTKKPYYFKDHKSHNFEEPIFSFVQSIAISEIIRLPNNFSEHYKDNFLISSLNGISLYRIKFDESYSKVLFYEEIYIGERIRDLKYHNDTKTIFLSLETNGEIGILYK